MPADDCTVVRNLWLSMKGDPKEAPDNSTVGACCSWRGSINIEAIQCDSEKRITYLDLSYRQLGGAIPDNPDANWKNLQKLQTLYFSSVGFLEVLDIAIGDGNQLSGPVGPVPASISRLPELVTCSFGPLAGAQGWNCSSACEVTNCDEGR
jgi:hypothetical protein